MKLWTRLSLSLSCLAAIAIPPLQATDLLLEAKAGYLLPTDSAAANLYNDNARYELEGTVQIFKCIYGFASGGYYYSCGKTIGLEEGLSLDIVTMAAGLKYFYTLNERCDALYLGVGALPTFVTVRDRAARLHPHTRDWTVGGIIKGGAILTISRCFFMDAFIDYSIIRVKGEGGDDPLTYTQKTALDALTLGIGIGYRF